MGKRKQGKQRTARGPASAPARPALPVDREPLGRRDAAIALLVTLVVAMLLGALAYGNATRGGFVYDDHRQIVANPQIQQPGLLKQALTSDVWSFRGEAQRTASNYWRPVFVLWLALQFALFGLDPHGWHLANLGLHLLATGLAFFVLRELRLDLAASAAAIWLFATHPAHVESVTWISGSPDLLVACFLFAAFLCYRRAGRGHAAAWHAIASVCFLGALLSKEIAVVFPLIVLIDAWIERRAATWNKTWKKTLTTALPYFACLAIYAVARVWLVGMERISPPGAPGLAGVLLTVPSLAIFYLRHALFPGLLGPSYSPAPVTTLTMTNFALPLLGIVAMLCAIVWLVRRGRVYGWAVAWAILPLAPAFDIRAFVPEDLVHDRYLYLPLFGVLVLLAAGAQDLAKHWLHRRAEIAVVMIALPVALLGAAAARHYNPIWNDDIALWERGVKTNPDHAFSHTQLADAYRAAGRGDEARTELARALELNPGITAAHVTLAALDFQAGRLDEAQHRLEMVLEQYPNLSNAIEMLAMVYQKQGKSDAAIALFERGRIALPSLRPLYTVNLAVLHRLAGRSDRARQELESVQPELAVSRDPKALRGWYYLGELYREAGERDRAIAAYDRYLAATANITDRETLAFRAIVVAARHNAAT